MGTTKSLTKEAAVESRTWHVVDVTGMTLGRAASQIAHIIRGKHKPTWTPNQDAGDYVVVVNAGKVTLTGNKMSDKIYYDHTLFPGGIHRTPAGEMLRKKPTEAIKRAVWGMLPKGPLGRKMYKKLKVYATGEHPHVAQQPAALKISTGR